MVPTHEVAGRHDPCSRREGWIAPEPFFVDVEPGPLEPRRRGNRAHGDEQPIRRDGRAVTQPARHARCVPRTGFDSIETGAEPKIYALVAMHPCPQPADKRPDGPLQGRGEGLDDNHLGTEAPRGGRDLEADETGPGDDESGARAGDHAPQGNGVVDVAERHHTGTPRDARQRTRIGPGRDHEPVEGDLAAALSLSERAARSRLSARDPSSSSIPSASMLARCLQSAAVEVPRAREELLRQRRTVIGEAILAADEPQTSFEALFAKGFAGEKPGHACADGDDGPERGRDCYLPSSSWAAS